MVEATRGNESGCLFVFAVVAAELVFVGWFLGQFLLDPDLCAGPDCQAMRAALIISVISAIAGIGCVLLLAGNNSLTLRIPPILLLVAASGAFAIAAVAGVRAGLIILPLFDVVLMLGPIGLLLGNELIRTSTGSPHTRRLFLTWALAGLMIVIAFAVVVGLIVLK